jgi:hypothetical protein
LNDEILKKILIKKLAKTKRISNKKNENQILKIKKIIWSKIKKKTFVI